jgi:hypothetical protein
MNRSRRIMGLDLIVFTVRAVQCCTCVYRHVLNGLFISIVPSRSRTIFVKMDVQSSTRVYRHVQAPNGLIISIVPSTVEKHTRQDFGDVYPLVRRIWCSDHWRPPDLLGMAFGGTLSEKPRNATTQWHDHQCAKSLA